MHTEGVVSAERMQRKSTERSGGGILPMCQALSMQFENTLNNWNHQFPRTAFAHRRNAFDKVRKLASGLPSTHNQ